MVVAAWEGTTCSRTSCPWTACPLGPLLETCGPPASSWRTALPARRWQTRCSRAGRTRAQGPQVGPGPPRYPTLVAPVVPQVAPPVALVVTVAGLGAMLAPVVLVVALPAVWVQAQGQGVGQGVGQGPVLLQWVHRPAPRLVLAVQPRIGRRLGQVPLPCPPPPRSQAWPPPSRVRGTWGWPLRPQHPP